MPHSSGESPPENTIGGAPAVNSDWHQQAGLANDHYRVKSRVKLLAMRSAWIAQQSSLLRTKGAIKLVPYMRSCHIPNTAYMD